MEGDKRPITGRSS